MHNHGHGEEREDEHEILSNFESKSLQVIKNIIKETSDPYEWMHANENNLPDYVVEQMNCKLFNNAINEKLLREIIRNREEFSLP